VTPGRVLTPPPALGQHNREVFGELLGLGDAELQALAQAGIV
jgi:crotonobetainyl-CoA:carnitine CoA-transferase CaiB-like acyl-CoA transferase